MTPPLPADPRVAVILCRVLELEVEHFARDQPQVVRIEKLPQGLHNEPQRLRAELQAAIHRVEDDPAPNVIALGYGLCCRATEEITTRRCTLVMPRAHDCITLLLGSKERYAQYVAQCPGTYWYSPGWIEHHIPPGPERFAKLRADFVARFGEDNADYLMETEQGWMNAYQRATYVDLGVGPIERDLETTRSCARFLNWEFDRQHGDPDLLRCLVRGP